MSIDDDITFHYPPDLMALLIDTVPLLCKSKRDVILFFRGAGVNSKTLQDFETELASNPKSLNKYQITREVLTAENASGERGLRNRREIIRRVVGYEDFSVCWPDDQLKAKALVSEIRKTVNVKDSFTRMENEREAERKQNQAIAAERQRQKIAQQQAIELVRKDLGALFGDTNPQRRGKRLEGVLNQLFKVYGIQVTEAFEQLGSAGEGIVEQIDGSIMLDGHIYLVEMKWWKQPIGLPEVGAFLVKVFSRSQVRGLMISASGFTEPAVAEVRSALRQSVVTLCDLSEIVLLLDRGDDLRDLLREKVAASIVHKNPFYRPLSQ